MSQVIEMLLFSIFFIICLCTIGRSIELAIQRFQCQRLYEFGLFVGLSIASIYIMIISLVKILM